MSTEGYCWPPDCRNKKTVTYLSERIIRLETEIDELLQEVEWLRTVLKSIIENNPERLLKLIVGETEQINVNKETEGNLHEQIEKFK